MSLSKRLSGASAGEERRGGTGVPAGASGAESAGPSARKVAFVPAFLTGSQHGPPGGGGGRPRSARSAPGVRALTRVIVFSSVCFTVRSLSFCPGLSMSRHKLCRAGRRRLYTATASAAWGAPQRAGPAPRAGSLRWRWDDTATWAAPDNASFSIQAR